MEELLFIINPTANSGKAKDLEPIIKSKMEQYHKNFKVILTTEPHEATDIAYDSKIETVIAVGGDGTVTEVAKGIINRGYGTLGILPGGTGNDFRKSLNIPEDIDKAIENIIKGNKIKVDVGVANGYTFLNVGGIGLDVEVLKTLRRVKKHIKGNIAYIISVIITLFKFKRMDVRLEIDGKESDKNLVLFGAGNGRYIGGGLQLIPQAKSGDGYLHSTVVEDVSNLRILTIFPEIFKGTHLRHKKYVETFKFKNAKIFSDKELYINLDGEVFYAGKEIDFSLADKKLEVIVPK